ncbi:hypothetical protein [Paraburkholderia hospita]|uniref:hypothetical protein n=1 Tax=Paraburkholderia hospita TaxID=169430 RepID=UPI00105600B5|nr:hypothetical protein [Paraburkholderia hospita]
MHPKDHPAVSFKNLLELLFQAPFWIILYGTGATFFIQMLTWVFYGLGWYYHPRIYPMPHSQLMDFYAESMRWLRNESRLSRKHPRIARILAYTISAFAFAGFPFIFVKYCHYLAWLYLGDTISGYQRLWNLLIK